MPGVGERDARIPARYKRFIAERRREWHSFARSASRVDAASRIHHRYAVVQERASGVQNDGLTEGSVRVTTWKE
jgi:hypothetical protein